MKKCKHDKVYANYTLTSEPPQYPWICRICKERGTDRGDPIIPSDYDRLVREAKCSDQ